MATENTAKLKFKYNDETTRNYDFQIDEDNMNGVAFYVKRINSSLSAGTDDGLSTFFISKTGSPLKEISEAQLVSVEEIVLDLGGNN